MREREREREHFVWENKICIKWKRVTNLQYEDNNKKNQKKKKKEEEDKGAKLYVKLKPPKRNMYRLTITIHHKHQQPLKPTFCLSHIKTHPTTMGFVEDQDCEQNTPPKKRRRKKDPSRAKTKPMVVNPR